MLLTHPSEYVTQWSELLVGATYYGVMMEYVVLFRLIEWDISGYGGVTVIDDNRFELKGTD